MDGKERRENFMRREFAEAILILSSMVYLGYFLRWARTTIKYRKFEWQNKKVCKDRLCGFIT
ncbi:MAG: hypothetical protein WCK48_00965 [bacterium]